MVLFLLVQFLGMLKSIFDILEDINLFNAGQQNTHRVNIKTKQRTHKNLASITTINHIIFNKKQCLVIQNMICCEHRDFL